MVKTKPFRINVKSWRAWRGGLNTNDPAYQVSPAQFVDSQDVRVNDVGNVVKRTGRTKLNSSAISSGATTNYVTTLHSFVDEWTNRNDYGICGNKIYRLAATPSELSDSLGFTKSLTESTRASIFTWKNRVFVSNGEESPFSYGIENYRTTRVFVSDLYAYHSLTGSHVDFFTTTGTFQGYCDDGVTTGVKGLAWDGTNEILYRCLNSVNYISCKNGKNEPLGVWSTADDSLYGPYAIALDVTRGYVFVSFTTTNKIGIYGLKGNYIGNYDIAYASRGLAYHGGGATKYLYVTRYSTTTLTACIECLDVTDVTAISSVVTFGKVTTPEFGKYVGGCAVDVSTNLLYICEGQTNYVQVWDISTPATPSQGSSLPGGAGTGNTQFGSHSPDNIVLDDTNSMFYVVDNGNSRIKKLNLSGTYQTKWGSYGTADGQFTDIYGIAVVETSSDLQIDAFRDLGTPPSPRVAETSVAGMTGTYKYACSYVTAAGNESSLGVESASLATTAHAIVVSCPTSTNPDVTQIYLYRSKYSASWSNWAYVSQCSEAEYTTATVIRDTLLNGAITATDATITVDSTSGFLSAGMIIIDAEIIKYTGVTATTFTGCVRGFYGGTKVAHLDDALVEQYGDYEKIYTFTDNATDGTEGSAPSTVNGLAPYCKYLIQHRDILFGAGDLEYPGRLFWTGALDEHNWFSSYYIPIGDSDEGTITGLISAGDRIYVFKDNAIYGISLNSVDSLIDVRPYLVSKFYGCTSHFALRRAAIDGTHGVMFIDKDKGICFLPVGGTPKDLGTAVHSNWIGYDKTLLKNAYAEYYPATNEYWVALTTTGTTNNEVWVYNTLLKCIYKPFTQDICSFGKTETSAGVEQIWSGDFSGTVWKEDQGTADNLLAITSWFTTPNIDCGLPDNEKIFDKVIIEYIEQTAGTLTVYWAVDSDSFTNSFTITLTGTANKRNVHEQWLPKATTGRTLKVKCYNAAADEPFEVINIGIEGRIRKEYTP